MMIWIAQELMTESISRGGKRSSKRQQNITLMNRRYQQYNLLLMKEDYGTRYIVNLLLYRKEELLRKYFKSSFSLKKGSEWGQGKYHSCRIYQVIICKTMVGDFVQFLDCWHCKSFWTNLPSKYGLRLNTWGINQLACIILSLTSFMKCSVIKQCSVFLNVEILFTKLGLLHWELLKKI